MSKAGSRYICERCGSESARWHGKCPACGEWNALVEFKAPAHNPAALRTRSEASPVSALELAEQPQIRRQTGVAELDQALGGGIVSGALILLGGEPGVGKSTLLLQSANSFAEAFGVCLYVSGEESPGQVVMRSRRLGSLSPRLLFLAETNVIAIEEQVRRTSPQLMVVDSIQALYSPETEALPGAPSQVRDCATRLLRVAKDLAIPTFLVGHVTKDGSIAGPRLLEHMVDTVLSLEGDRHSGYRVLRTTKNRFGSTDELSLFRMTEKGLEGVPDASAALLAERRSGIPGSSIAAAIEGSRPLLVEIQALVSPTPAYGNPRRNVTGVDYNRACLMLAVLEKCAGVSLATQDVFINIPGGVRVTEPALDLGLALALASSIREQPLDAELACMGEVGLTGEVRSVPRVEVRLAELARRGFCRCLIPRMAEIGRPEGIEVIPVEDLRQAFKVAFRPVPR